MGGACSDGRGVPASRDQIPERVGAISRPETRLPSRNRATPTIGVPAFAGMTSYINSACASAASTAFRLASLGQVIGRRSVSGKHSRTLVIAYLTGPGHGPENIALCSWNSLTRTCSRSYERRGGSSLVHLGTS